MPLDPTKLQRDLQKVLESMPADPATAAEGFASAYHNYAKGALFGPNIPAIPDPKKDALKATLLAAIANPLVGVPGALAGAWSAGVATYWTAVPVAGPTTAGATTPPPGAGAITGSMTAVLANIANTAALCATGMAAALDTATKTTIATVAPPPSTMVPIT